MKFTKIVKAESNPTPEELEIFKNARSKAEQIAAKYSYEVDCGRNTYVTVEHPFSDIRIGKERFWPEGWIRKNIFDNDEVEDGIQTTSYGALNLEDYAEYLNHCHKALECLKELKETFFK